MNVDKNASTHAMIRVNQAGEYGAVRIYKGQMAILKNSPLRPTLEEMLRQEEDHLQRFNAMVAKNKVRPTLLSPLWHVGAYALGMITAFLGEKAALACTVAVEEVIDQHYEQQKETLKPVTSTDLKELKDTIIHCQADEIHHKNLALDLGAEQAPAYSVLSGVIKTISKTAIWLSTRL